MQTLTLRARLLYTIAGVAVLAAMPIDIDFAKAGWTVKASYVFAKDGRDDDNGGGGRGGRDDNGGGRGGRDDNGGGRGGRDDDNGGGSRGGRDDNGGSDDSNRGDNSGGASNDASDDSRSADDGNDHGGGRGRGRGDDRAGDDSDDRTGTGGAKVEISRNGIEVEQANGTKEEIEGGRYERKDVAGRIVEERRATQADIDRLRGLAGPGVVAATRRVGSGAVASVEISADGIEVLNNDGVKEAIENGRYERKDVAGRTVEERPATQADIDRLQLAARGARTERRISVGSVAEVERSAAGLEVVYSTGWKEEFEGGRYELKDPNGNTVVERSATKQDRARMTRLAGG